MRSNRTGRSLPYRGEIPPDMEHPGTGSRCTSSRSCPPARLRILELSDLGKLVAGRHATIAACCLEIVNYLGSPSSEDFVPSAVGKAQALENWQAMDTMKSADLSPAKATKGFEGEALAEPQSLDPVALCRGLVQAGAASAAEIEKLMGELQAARDYLHSEGERLQREAARYATLTHRALESVKLISESMDKWRQTAPSNLTQVA